MVKKIEKKSVKKVEAKVAAPKPAPTQKLNQPRELRLGDAGRSVEVLQSKLIQLGYAPNRNGKFQDETLAAVRAFQASKKLRGDGIVGDQTWAELLK